LTAERGARWLAALVALALVALLAWVAARPRLGEALVPAWTDLAPSPEIAMPPWRWIVIHRAPAGPCHLLVGEAAGAMRADATAWWHLQRPVPGSGDALVLRLAPAGGHGEETVVAGVCAELVRHVPTLAVKRITGPRGAAVPGIDLDRVRFRVRELAGGR
jgi:hypothetical protein